jgi:autotransporter-associated beta strand protein
MPPTTARRRWTVVLAVQLAAALLAAGAQAGSAAGAGELVWLGEAGGQPEGRWTTDPSVRPWRDADGNPAAFQDGQPVVLDERAVNRAVVVADPDGVSPASVRFSHRTGRYTLDALGPAGVTGLTSLTVDGDGELEVRNANGYAGTTDLRRGLLSLGDDAALGHSTLLVGGGAVRALGDRRLANPVRFRHPHRPGPVTATITGDGDLTIAGEVELNPGHPTNLAVDGAGVARLVGAVRDPAGGPGTLVKLGGGVLELGGGGNRYRGGTVVAGGTVLAGATGGSATGSGPVAVRAAATLGGAGTLRGPVTVQRGGTVAPGDAPGDAATLATTGRLALRRGAVLDIDVVPDAAAGKGPGPAEDAAADGHSGPGPAEDAAADGHSGPGPAEDAAADGADLLRVDGGVRLDRAELRVTVAAGAGRWTAGGATRGSSCSATSGRRGCRSSPSGSGTAPAICTTTSWWRSSTTCSASRRGGGCSCAGPYGHRLLGIDPLRSRALAEQARRGYLGVKPGWARVSFNYFISDTVCDYLIDAVDLVATHGHRLLGDYRFDPRDGLWRHRHAPAEPPLSLADVRYHAGGLTAPGRHAHAGEDALAGHLREGRRLLAARPDRPEEGPTGLPADVEALRWFPLPPGCLDHAAQPALAG